MENGQRDRHVGRNSDVDIPHENCLKCHLLMKSLLGFIFETSEKSSFKKKIQLGPIVPRGNCNHRLENGRLKIGRFKTGHFEIPCFSCFELQRLD